MNAKKTVAFALALLHMCWLAAPAMAGRYEMPVPREIPLADLPGMEQMVRQHPEIDDALGRVMTGIGRDVDGSPRVWRLALLEGVKQVRDWTAGPEEWVPLLVTEYNGRATMISFRPKPGVEGEYEGRWTNADGTPVTDAFGSPLPQPEILVGDEEPDEWILPAIAICAAVVTILCLNDVHVELDVGVGSFECN